MPRRKDLEHGDRVNFYIKKDLPPELLEYINKQYDLTTFLLYAVEQLYEKTGNVDITTFLPRNYKIGEGMEPPGPAEKPALTVPKPEPAVKKTVKKEEVKPEPKKQEPEEEETGPWSNNINEFEDPFS